MITLLDGVLIMNDTVKYDYYVAESQVFLIKMKGDYYRYMAEYSSGEELKKVSEKAQESYERAMEIGEKELKDCNPIKLGLALNFSVFTYEICNEKEKACAIGKKAHDAAMELIEEVSEDLYREMTPVMQLIRDNLTLWSLDSEEESQATLNSQNSVI